MSPPGERQPLSFPYDNQQKRFIALYLRSTNAKRLRVAKYLFYVSVVLLHKTDRETRVCREM